MTHSGVAYAALQTEVTELQGLARGLAEFAPDFSPNLIEWTRHLQQVWQSSGPPFVLEQQMEWFARALRQHWLQYAAAAPSAVYRSPTEEQQKGMAEDPKLEAFGYERDLQPEILEQRCARFFPRPLPPWQAQHLLFSSGQAAMTAALLVRIGRLGVVEIEHTVDDRLQFGIGNRPVHRRKHIARADMNALQPDRLAIDRARCRPSRPVVSRTS